MARIYKRSLGVIPFTANGIARLDLPRNHVFKGMLLRLTGAMTVAGGATNGTLASEQPQCLVKLARVIRNGSEVLQALDGGTLFALARINSDGDPQRVPLTTAAVGAAQAFSVDIPIDFASWRMATPGMSLLRAVGTSSLVLEIAWGNADPDLVFGGDRTESIDAGCQIEVFSEELMDLTGDFGDKILYPTDKLVTASATEFLVDLPIGQLYRRIVFKTTHQNGSALVDTLINRIRIISDGFFYHCDRMAWAALQGQNKRHYSLVNTSPGYAVVDFAEDGNPAGMIDTRGASTFQALLDVTFTGAVNNNNVRVVTETFTPARVAA